MGCPGGQSRGQADFFLREEGARAVSENGGVEVTEVEREIPEGAGPAVITEPVLHRAEARELAYLFWGPQDLANFEDCVDLTGPREEWPECIHLGHDAAHGPDVDGGAVVGGPQEHFWSPVPGGEKGSCLLLLPLARVH